MTIITVPAEKAELPSPDISIIMNHNRFGTLSRLLRTTAWINRFIQHTRQPQQQTPNSLSAKEVITSLNIWMKSVQKKAFPIEMAYLNSNQLGKRPALVRQLDLYLQDGIIRCIGRMNNTDKDFDAALNDRPLTYVSTEKSESKPVTPSHLLFRRRIIPFLIENPPELDEDADITFTERPSSPSEAVTGHQQPESSPSRPSTLFQPGVHPTVQPPMPGVV